MDNHNKKPTKKTGARRVISYFWKMTMTSKLSFSVAFVGMVITSLASLLLPIYYTKIIDIVQMSTAARTTLVPILLGILVAMAIIELCNIG